MEKCIKRWNIWRDGPRDAGGKQIFGPLDKKPHQDEGVRWCLSRELFASTGGILADEMGLGKTYEMMGLIVSNFVSNTLIVVPPSLLEQWKSCLIKYVCGSRGLYVFHGKGAKNNFELKSVVLTTYMMIGKLVDKKDIVWDRIIYDEAHHLRNRQTNIFRNASRLRGFLKWGVTGTPIQNRLGDFYALCQILSLPCDLTRKSEFMLRRTKDSVGLKLPAVSYIEVDVMWKTEKEEEFAVEIHGHANLLTPNKKNVDRIIRDMSVLSWNMLVMLLRARQVCVYPKMLKSILDGHVDETFLDMVSCSKIESVLKQVSTQNGNSKLLFCHFRSEIDILALELRLLGLSVGVIDGRTSRKKRKSILETRPLTVSEFDDCFDSCIDVNTTNFVYENVMSYLRYDVLIVQIQTACEGLNLQHYQEVHFVSPHWNPAVEDQAIARCHRIGQDKPVSVYRYTMNGFGEGIVSFDEYCRNVQDVKRELLKLL